MGQVVLAKQVALGRTVAIKFLRLTQTVDKAEWAARFRREAELMAQVSHPNIATIFDFGTADGRPYLVMEYIEGGDLRREMVAHKPMPVGRALAVVRSVAKALECLHSQGILHRDLKPENVLMHDHDTPKIADFGVAVSDSTMGMLTGTDVSMGTVGYVAPEQLYRLKVNELADQYALAAITYELLTGYKPLGSFQPPSRLNGVLRPEVDAVLLKALSEDRDDRYPSIREFSDSLERAVSGARGRGRTRFALLATIGVFLVALMIVAYRYWLHPGRSTVSNPDNPGSLAKSKSTIVPASTHPPDPVVNKQGMKLVLIPAGKFSMGSPDTDPVARANEKPPHQVTISHPFYLGAYEVTVGQFRAFVEQTGYRTDAESDGKGGYIYNDQRKSKDQQTIVSDPRLNWRHPGYPREQTDDEPVVQVSWNDAMAFCRWLSGQEGVVYRLPTEAEWEYACRAGTSTLWSSGNSSTQLESYAWTPNSGSPTTHPVGSKQPNPFGVFDMHGNVWEWCLDYVGPYQSAPEQDPLGPSAGVERVLRGGAWDRKNIRRTKSAYRISAEPSYRNYTYGFRVCRPFPK
jgi:formylglycine-generating enzyme required for sulfatase activity